MYEDMGNSDMKKVIEIYGMFHIFDSERGDVEFDKNGDFTAYNITPDGRQLYKTREEAEKAMGEEVGG